MDLDIYSFYTYTCNSHIHLYLGTQSLPFAGFIILPIKLLSNSKGREKYQKRKGKECVTRILCRIYIIDKHTPFPRDLWESEPELIMGL